MGRFREALDDVNVRVSEQTLIEVGRYFQAPTLTYRRGQHGNHDSGYRSTQARKGAAIDCAPVEMAYVPLTDIVFGRKCVREPRSEAQIDGGDTTDNLRRDREGRPGQNPRWTDDDDRCFVNVGRIRAARIAVIETPDALGRSPLFLAAAADGVSAVKALIRHGAASSLAVEGTDLTPYSVAPSSLMRRVLAAEARHSLYQAIAKRNNGHRLAEGSEEDKTVEHELAASLDDPAKAIETQRMETWVRMLAEGEHATNSASETRADQKTSLHLAATAGLPEAVKDLLGRGMGEPKDEGRHARPGGACLAQPAWKTSWKPPEHMCEEPRLNTTHLAIDHHQTFSHDSLNAAARATDANGWSALHACCGEASPQHYSCALALLGSQRDPNARTNTGKTPLHVAAVAASSAEVRGGVSCLSDMRRRSFLQEIIPPIFNVRRCLLDS